MKKDNKKALYESIMSSVAKEVKKALNESEEYVEDHRNSPENKRWMQDQLKREEAYRTAKIKRKFQIGDCVRVIKSSDKVVPNNIEGYITDITENAGRPLYTVTFFGKDEHAIRNILKTLHQDIPEEEYDRNTEPDFWHFYSYQLEKVFND